MVADIVFAVAVELTKGAVLSANDITAGRGTLIDWRTVKSGENLLEDADAFDIAYLFVALAGWGAVAVALEKVAA